MINDVLKGHVVAGARMMRRIDDRLDGSLDELKEIYKHTGKALIVGVTGNPGAGKSTVVDSLIGLYRNQGHKVGVVCVDPTSPFSGGAILGDRIRMQRHANDKGVFIRSLATRGNLGGLSRSTFDVAAVLDAMGYDRILIETVGVGQDEVDVMRAAHVSLVVTVPGLGDDIQAIKAGILEIADVLVVNKADREGADRAMRDLFYMLELRGPDGKREVPICKTVATLGLKEESGLSALVKEIEALSHLKTDQSRKEFRAKAQLSELIKSHLADKAESILSESDKQHALTTQIADGGIDPYTAAEQILSKI